MTRLEPPTTRSEVQRANVWVNSKSDHPPPGQTPGQTPGHLTFLKMLDQIPRYMGRFQGQMPHWLGMKSQNFHNLSGNDERIVKKYSAHKVRHKDQKAQTKVTYQCIPWIQNRYVFGLAIYIVLKDSTSSAWLMLFLC